MQSNNLDRVKEKTGDISRPATLISEHCWIRIVLILQLSQSSSLNISHQSWDSVVKCWQVGACKDGEGWNKCIYGQRAGDGIRSTWQIHSSHSPAICRVSVTPIYRVWIDLVTHRWVMGQSMKHLSCSDKAVAMALLGCPRGMNAFITVVPFGGWATILRFFLFYFKDSRRINAMLKVTGSISCRARN